VAAFCPCCGAEIPLKAEACPLCGNPLHGMSRSDVPLTLALDTKSSREDIRNDRKSANS
jgi:predicted amidophosphoribosyltransferase